MERFGVRGRDILPLPSWTGYPNILLMCPLRTFTDGTPRWVPFGPSYDQDQSLCLWESVFLVIAPVCVCAYVSTSPGFRVTRVYTRVCTPPCLDTRGTPTGPVRDRVGVWGGERGLSSGGRPRPRLDGNPPVPLGTRSLARTSRGGETTQTPPPDRSKDVRETSGFEVRTLG